MCSTRNSRESRSAGTPWLALFLPLEDFGDLGRLVALAHADSRTTLGFAQPREGALHHFGPERIVAALLGAHGVDAAALAAVEQNAARYAHEMAAAAVGDVLGPAPYPIARLNNEWRCRFAIKTKDVSSARRALRELVVPLAARERATRLAVTVDP